MWQKYFKVKINQFDDKNGAETVNAVSWSLLFYSTQHTAADRRPIGRRPAWQRFICCTDQNCNSWQSSRADDSGSCRPATSSSPLCALPLWKSKDRSDHHTSSQPLTVPVSRSSNAFVLFPLDKCHSEGRRDLPGPEVMTRVEQTSLELEHVSTGLEQNFWPPQWHSKASPAKHVKESPSAVTSSPTVHSHRDRASYKQQINVNRRTESRSAG